MPNSHGGKHGREHFPTRLMNTVTSRKSPVMVDVLLLFIGLPEGIILRFRGPFPIANPFSSRFLSKFFGLGFLEILGLRGLQVGTPMSQIKELTHAHQGSRIS